MGWDYVKGWSRARLVLDIIKPQSFVISHGNSKGCKLTRKTLAHRVVPFNGCSGDPSHILWSVIEDRITDGTGQARTDRYILCSLLQAGCGGYGHKDMTEQCGPYYYSCPVEYLDMVPETCAEWREKVRELAETVCLA